MKFWYLILRLAPAFILLAGLATAVVDALTLMSMPEPMRAMLPAGGAFVMLPAFVMALLSVVGAAVTYWLGRLVDQLIPGVKG